MYLFNRQMERWIIILGGDHKEGKIKFYEELYLQEYKAQCSLLKVKECFKGIFRLRHHADFLQVSLCLVPASC
jgi:hypothetical protein